MGTCTHNLCLEANICKVYTLDTPVLLYELLVKRGILTFHGNVFLMAMQLTFFRYARAGDKFSSSPDCQPMGAFQIDLSGTPVSLVPDTRWAWIGNYTRGNVIDGQARVKNDSKKK